MREANAYGSMVVDVHRVYALRAMMGISCVMIERVHSDALIRMGTGLIRSRYIHEPVFR